MAGLDELFNEIPISDIATKLGVDEGEVTSAVHTLVPLLLGGLQQNAQDPDGASNIASAANNHAASGLLDGGVAVDQVDEAAGSKAIAKIFGGNDTGQVAAAFAGGGAGSSGLLKQLLPILAPIVLAYIGKQMTKGNAAPAEAPAQTAGGGGGLGDILGSILGGAAGGGGSNNALGSILGSVLGGGGQGGGGALGDILGGLLGGKK